MKDASQVVPQRLKPRKTPVQSRSGVTVEAIHEAAIQVLLSEGLSRLTTTRVAERGGVSVGTLYQYFPNKEALLFAILLRHFEEVAEALERVDIAANGRPLEELAESIADAYVSVKVARPDATIALYRVAGAIDQFKMSPDIHVRLVNAVVRVLANASDASFTEPRKASFTLLSALAGVSRGSFANLAYGPEILDGFREEARLLSRAYLRAAAQI